MMKKLMLMLLVFLPVLLVSGTFYKPISTNFGSFFPIPSRDNVWLVTESWTENYNSWDEVWWNQAKAVYHFNVQYPAKIDSIIGYAWAEEDSIWLQDSRRLLHYYPGHEYIEMTEWMYSFGSVEIPALRSYATYDDSNRLIRLVVDLFDSDSAVWNTYMRQHFLYGAGTTFEVHSWEAGYDEEPAIYTKSTSVFDGSGRIIESISQTSVDSLNWVNTDRLTRTYHPHDTSTGEDMIYRIAHEYPMLFLGGIAKDFFGMISEDLKEIWDAGQWINGTKDFYTYDTDDNLTQYLYQEWISDAWQNGGRYNYSLDANGNAEQEFAYWWHTTLAEWVPEYRTHYTWDEFSSQDENFLPSIPKLNISAFPNPFYSHVELQIDSKSSEPIHIGIYNLKGQCVRKLTANKDQNLIWDAKDSKGKDTAPGLYFLQASQGKERTTQKVLRIR